MMTTIEKRMRLSSGWSRGDHWQKHAVFVGVLFGEGETNMVLPRLRSQFGG